MENREISDCVRKRDVTYLAEVKRQRCAGPFRLVLVDCGGQVVVMVLRMMMLVVGLLVRRPCERVRIAEQLQPVRRRGGQGLHKRSQRLGRHRRRRRRPDHRCRVQSAFQAARQHDSRDGRIDRRYERNRRVGDGVERWLQGRGRPFVLVIGHGGTDAGPLVAGTGMLRTVHPATGETSDSGGPHR